MNFAFCLFKYCKMGGLELDFLRIVAACLRRGHAITVYTMVWEGSIPEGVEVNIVPVFGVTNHGRAMGFARKLPRLLARKSFDLVVGFNKMPALEVCYVADLCYKSRAKWWVKWSRRYYCYVQLEQAVFVLSTNTQILYLSELVKRQYIDCYGTPPERFQQLSPGLAAVWKPDATVEQQRREMRVLYKISSHQKLVLLIANNFQLKGLDRALLALAALPAAVQEGLKFFIVGAGEQAIFQRKVSQLGLATTVEFLGGRSDIRQLLLAADLLLHPARREAAGLVVVEALACGVPVLVTADCGYAPYVAEAQAGQVLASPFQQQQFNELLQQSLTQLQQWGQNALRYAQSADWYGREAAALLLEEFANQL